MSLKLAYNLSKQKIMTRPAQVYLAVGADGRDGTLDGVIVVEAQAAEFADPHRRGPAGAVVGRSRKHDP